MTQAALLLGISKAARKYIWAMERAQIIRMPREETFKSIRGFVRPVPPIHKDNCRDGCS